jgi:hypothetical protein
MPTLRTAAEVEYLLPWNMTLGENRSELDRRKTA